MGKVIVKNVVVRVGMEVLEGDVDKVRAEADERARGIVRQAMREEFRHQTFYEDGSKVKSTISLVRSGSR
jgi:hypothetical protein